MKGFYWNIKEKSVSEMKLETPFQTDSGDY